jgi:hypothetical protein
LPAFDPDAERIVAWTFVHRNDALDDAIAKTEHFLRAQMGDVRSVSIDSLKSRQLLLLALHTQTTNESLGAARICGAVQFQSENQGARTGFHISRGSK